MWNPFTIARDSLFIWRRNKPENHHYGNDAPVNAVVSLYTQMLFPSNLFTVRKLRSLKNGQKLLSGVDRYAKEWQEGTYIPLITDGKYLDGLSANTVGAHYRSLIKQWSFGELYNARFQQTIEHQQAGPILNWLVLKLTDATATDANEVRANISRHIFLAHDFWHVLFRYPTTPLGEACIQALTHQMTSHFGPWYLSYLVGLRESVIYKSWGPLKAVREAHKLGRRVNQNFYLIDFQTLLESDIQEVRGIYNIGFNKEYWKFVEGRDMRNDVIHPEYKDAAFSNESVIL